MANGHGGPRQGAPGVSYPNRTDMNSKPRSQPVRAAPGQPYGARGAQEDAQRAQPLPQATPLNAPTQRPGEPVTAGAPLGAGGGPQDYGIPAPIEGDDTVGLLRALYQQFPNDDLLDLLSELEG